MHIIESLLSSFLWKGHMKVISWDSLCRPKVEGGLGFRRLGDIVNVATTRKLWTILDSDSSLWAQWMRDKNIRTSNF